ncbi:MAG: serine hydrolase domain-containing protein [Pseudomonadota bacterium]|nr:serine hydrolase domain-containing protein [Pseudomonadota bacterium]
MNQKKAIFLLLVSFYGFSASAEPGHIPKKMPVVNAELVGMSTEGLNRIDELMQEHINLGHIQGGVTIVARRGRVVHFSTHGEMDSINGRAMETDTIFAIASMTKPVLGVAAMIAIEDGLIKASDAVSKYIPEFKDMKVVVRDKSLNAKGKDGFKAKLIVRETGPKSEPRLEALESPVTIHHLLTHTSGLGKLRQSEKPKKDDTLATYIPRLAKVPLNFQPGTHWEYSLGLDIVARVIEIVSKTPFDIFVQERIFDPLEMSNTFFYVPNEKRSKAFVYTGIAARKSKDWFKPTKYVSASAGLSSTAEDFLHFQQMLLNGGELFGQRVLSQDSVDMMSRNHAGDLFERTGKGIKGIGMGYTVSVVTDSNLARNYRGKGSFGWAGATRTDSWTDPENELVAVYFPAKPRGGNVYKDFQKAVLQAINKN